MSFFGGLGSSFSDFGVLETGLEIDGCPVLQRILSQAGGGVEVTWNASGKRYAERVGDRI